MYSYVLKISLEWNRSAFLRCFVYMTANIFESLVPKSVFIRIHAVALQIVQSHFIYLTSLSAFFAVPALTF